MPSTRCGNLSVEIEGRARLLAPRLQRVMVEIASLDPNAGNRDYMQVAGGTCAYIVECRQYDGPSFRHAAGHPGPVADDWVKVATNGFHVTVRRNEKLTYDEVHYLHQGAVPVELLCLARHDRHARLDHCRAGENVMGFKVAWVAVKGKSSDTVVSDLDLERTGEYEAFPGSEYSIVTMPSGWVVVVNCFAFGDFILEAPLDRVKRGAEVLTCYVNETTMMSDLSAYENGASLWSVTHESERELDDLQVIGTPPEPYASIRDGLVEQHDAASDDVDYIFGIAADLGEALTGFRHDTDIAGLGPTPFELLAPARKPPPPKTKFFGLFGRRS